MDALLAAIASGNRALAKDKAESMKGPVGRMLAAGVEHMDEPKELMDEVMYEQALHTRLKVNGLLPFIAISASSAPLLGLLGTVTGIMNTFTLMTVFGTGDVKTLSSGISEALITTEYGLIVAIPALLIHSFLSRKAKGISDDLDKAAIAFGNEVARHKLKSEAASAA
jgi:biopolymer transport protein ExbB